MNLVKTSVGTFEGSSTGISGKLGNETISFLGIKFAVAKRFEYPTPISEPSDVVISANKLQNSCPQICRSLPAFCPYEISEDCLYLNIWTPFRNSSGFESKVPVFVFIHGGSFEMGSGSAKVLNGQFLARELNALVVTFNYRLSIFGFPGWVREDFPSNPGIMDQRLALEWVYSNIGNFGGDIERTTLAGQSAGALSVLLHLSTYPQNTWFKHGFIMSPPGLAFRDKSKGSLELLKVSQELGCGSFLDVDCLKSKHLRELLNSYERIRKHDDTLEIAAQLRPVIDGVDIIDHPLLLVDNIPSSINLMIGLISNETSYAIDRVVPIDLGQNTASLIYKAIFGAKIFQDITKLHENNNFTYIGKQGLIEAMTDAIFSCTNLQLLNTKNNLQIFGYYWQAIWSGGSDDSQGSICGTKTCHSIDLAFLFNEPVDDVEQIVGARFRSYVGSFVTTGSPGQVEGKVWIPAGSNGENMMSFEKNIIQGDLNIHPRIDPCKYWSQNLNLLQSNYSSAESIHIPYWILVPLILFLLLIINIQNWLFLYTNYLRVRFKRPSTKLAVKGDEKLKLLTASMGLSPVPVEINIQNLSFHRNGRKILSNCNAIFKPGTMTAVIGPSGSGKTTLLSLVDFSN